MSVKRDISPFIGLPLAGAGLGVGVGMLMPLFTGASFLSVSASSLLMFGAVGAGVGLAIALTAFLIKKGYFKKLFNFIQRKIAERKAKRMMKLAIRREMLKRAGIIKPEPTHIIKDNKTQAKQIKRDNKVALKNSMKYHYGWINAELIGGKKGEKALMLMSKPDKDGFVNIISPHCEKAGVDKIEHIKASLLNPENHQYFESNQEMQATLQMLQNGEFTFKDGFAFNQDPQKQNTNVQANTKEQGVSTLTPLKPQTKVQSASEPVKTTEPSKKPMSSDEEFYSKDEVSKAAHILNWNHQHQKKQAKQKVQPKESVKKTDKVKPTIKDRSK